MCIKEIISLIYWGLKSRNYDINLFIIILLNGEHAHLENDLKLFWDIILMSIDRIWILYSNVFIYSICSM